ncbi:MAG TPA: class I SAM-dependent methyltransferase, partial [Candidatus Baltobacteraceae bacterium]|nr:class I SAM-dependent methyltransferase [Candidatus Baltobacteraceae bacterium]
PTPVYECTALLRAVPAGARRATFVDVGAGMGRVLMLASMHPFRQVVGVEVSAALCETARDNLVRWRRANDDLACKDLRVICADAASYAFPKGDLVVYLYNPFGEKTLGRVLERLSQRDGGECYVAYHTPVHRSVFDAYPRFERVRDLQFGSVYRLRA